MNNSRLRIERNLRIVKSKREELWNRNNTMNPDEVYRITMELLNWIVNSNEWFFRNYKSYRSLRNKNKETHNILLGMKQAYNSFKHNMDILSIEDRNYINFLQLENANYVIEQIVWISYEKIKHKGDEPVLVEAYKNYLDGESVLETFDKAIRFLNDCLREMKNN